MMHTRKIHKHISILTGIVAVCAAFPSQGEGTIGDGMTVAEGPYAEIVYVDVGPGDTIECLADDPGYIYLPVLDDGIIDSSVMTMDYEPPEIIVEPPGVRLFRLNGTVPELVADLPFNEDTLARTGHDFVEAGPFLTTPPPPEQILSLSNGDGYNAVLLLETTYRPDLHFDCTVFAMEDMMDQNTGMTVKKKAAKKKVAKANKRKVHKKKAAKKALRRKKKAATPG